MSSNSQSSPDSLQSQQEQPVSQQIQQQQINASNSYFNMTSQHHPMTQHQPHLPNILGSGNVLVGNNQLNIHQSVQPQHAAVAITASVAPSAQSTTPKPPSNINQLTNTQINTIHPVNPLINISTNPGTNVSSNILNSHGMQATACIQSSNPFQELLSLFECPVCFEFALPPIMQCQSGHIVCSNCRPKLTCCPTCRSALGNIRNLSMEKIAYSLKFPCKYTSYGCNESMSHETKLEHEDVCEFRMYNCPCPGASCKWQGTLDQVMPHLMQHHKSITTLQGEDIVFLATDITLPGAVDWVMMQSCFGYNFMLVLEKQEKHENYPQFFAVVQLIGTRRQAERFVYKLELNGQRRRLTWEATPRSIHDGVQQAIVNSDCLVFDTQTAQLFADSGNLGINVTISLN